MEHSKQQQVLQKVLSEAWNNPVFKQELMVNPIAAVKKLTGESFALPEGKILEVCDQSNPDKVYLNIPPCPNFDDVELTDAQLEEVAGGLIPQAFILESFPSRFPPLSKPESFFKS